MPELTARAGRTVLSAYAIRSMDFLILAELQVLQQVGISSQVLYLPGWKELLSVLEVLLASAWLVEGRILMVLAGSSATLSSLSTVSNQL